MTFFLTKLMMMRRKVLLARLLTIINTRVLTIVTAEINVDKIE